jgi:integrase/recombinase XerC
MSTIDVRKIAAGLSPTWVGYLRDWDRTLRAANHPETTRYDYLLAAAQLGRYLCAESPDTDANDAADDPCQVTRGRRPQTPSLGPAKPRSTDRRGR